MVTDSELSRLLSDAMDGELLGSEFPRPGRVYFAVKPTALRRAVNTLFGKLGARFMTISAIDHGLDIELLHHFSLGKVVVTIRTTYPKETSEADTIVDMIPAANLIERDHRRQPTPPSRHFSPILWAPRQMTVH